MAEPAGYVTRPFECQSKAKKNVELCISCFKQKYFLWIWNKVWFYGLWLTLICFGPTTSIATTPLPKKNSTYSCLLLFIRVAFIFATLLNCIQKSIRFIIKWSGILKIVDGFRWSIQVYTWEWVTLIAVYTKLTVDK